MTIAEHTAVLERIEALLAELKTVPTFDQNRILCISALITYQLTKLTKERK